MICKFLIKFEQKYEVEIAPKSKYPAFGSPRRVARYTVTYIKWPMSDGR